MREREREREREETERLPRYIRPATHGYLDDGAACRTSKHSTHSAHHSIATTHCAHKHTHTDTLQHSLPFSLSLSLSLSLCWVLSLLSLSLSLSLSLTHTCACACTCTHACKDLHGGRHALAHKQPTSMPLRMREREKGGGGGKGTEERGGDKTSITMWTEFGLVPWRQTPLLNCLHGTNPNPDLKASSCFSHTWSGCSCGVS